MSEARPSAERLRADDGEWDRFVAATAEQPFMQLTAWARANQARGWHVARIAVEGAAGGLGGAQLLVHRMRPGPWSRGYAPRGPVADDWQPDIIGRFTDAVNAEARTRRLTHVVVDPQLPAGHPVAAQLVAAGWRPIAARQINRTRIIDLTRTEDDLWADLRSKWRQYVRKAERAGVVAVEVGPDDLDEFGRIYESTARRVGFAVAAYHEVYRAFAADGRAWLMLTREPGAESSAGLLMLECGSRVVELYGGSTVEGLESRANYLLKWEAIKAARRRGLASYDVWGTDEFGVALFKAGFGGVERDYVGAFELVTDRVGKATFDLLSTARSSLGRLRRLPSRTAGSRQPETT